MGGGCCRRGGTGSGVKCTPGGTRVPAGPPPMDTPEKDQVKMGPLPPLPPFPQFTTEDLRRSSLGRNGDWIWIPEEEREERVPDGMRHLQERTMSLEDQVKNLQAQVQGQREGGDGALHPGGQGRGDGRALRGGEPGGDRALQHGRAREGPDGVQGWQDQVERLEKLLHERHGHGGPTWYQYGSGIPGEHGGDRAGNHGGCRGDRAWHGKEDVGDLGEKDTLKAVPVTLPVLPPQEGKEAGIVCGDWMVQVRLLIGDVAPNALQWWDDLMAEVMCRYQNWLQAGPLERLQMPSPQQGKYNYNATRRRLELRISTMLLASLPGALKTELVAARQLSSGEIMYKVLRHYQPGGVSEKTETLQSLTSMSTASTAKEATERLRKWRRHQLRAQELHVTLPDPSIMVKGLTTLCTDVLAGAPQASFRLSTFRLQQCLDLNPTRESLEAYYQMLLAEMEHLSLSPESTTTASGGSRSSAPDTPSGAKVKALKPGSPTPGGTSVCRAWGTEGGCRFGRECKFGHDWSSLADKATRCWIC